MPHTSLTSYVSCVLRHPRCDSCPSDCVSRRCDAGVAFTDLPRGGDVRLFPAFCTTAANTCVRLVTAISVPDSLQFQATAVVTRRSGFRARTVAGQVEYPRRMYRQSVPLVADSSLCVPTVCP